VVRFGWPVNFFQYARRGFVENDAQAIPAMKGKFMFDRCVWLTCGLALLALGAIAQEGTAAEPVRGFTPERLAATSSALVALIGVIAGGIALGRSGKGTVALLAGLIAIVGGGFVIATADGGLGTGNGIAGGVVAVVLGLISTALGAVARSRSSRTAQITGT
jgi:hypothetical protein